MYFFLFQCSVIPRLNIKIRTRYENNNGSSENCLNVNEEELKQRLVDHVDILTDPIDEKYYKKEEDLSIFKSAKTGRGPLQEGWRDTADIIMCSYKLVDVSFQVFGLQTKVEDWIMRAIRNVLLLGHRQAFAWIDEWHGMTLEDVRNYELGMQKETNERIQAAQLATDETGKKNEDEKEEKKDGEEEEEDKEEGGGENEKEGGSITEKKEGSTPPSPTSPAASNASNGSSGGTPQKTGYLSSWFKWS
ncbi:cytoplasmic phosphatidylinositol transfer protein 1-like [Macrobrachium nipponense]|uniref:cytoplasmic phosphatidylinositol transfer protein 1-like n=1 Tax=Macrobrachium nipponense TaxID=159736 RepID=UPI0030C8535D